MAKYRLSYLGYGGYKSVALEKLDCLKEKKVTDIQVIDEFTTSFENMDSLLEFLKRNKIIADNVHKLVITVDKKENNETINKKIYRGENLLFECDKEFLNMSFVYKWIITNSNSEFMIDICDNYIEKYKNAFNRITGSSYILDLFNSLREAFVNRKYMSAGELKEFDDMVVDFINLEFYKIDKDVLINTGKIKRKVEKDGTYKKSYRNIHDFIILLKSMGLDLTEELIENVGTKNRDTVLIKDNIENIDIEEESEEYITEDDILRVNKELLLNYKDITNDDMCVDGNDFYRNITKEELEECLYESGMLLVKTAKKEDLK